MAEHGVASRSWRGEPSLTTQAPKARLQPAGLRLVHAIGGRDALSEVVPRSVNGRRKLRVPWKKMLLPQRAPRSCSLLLGRRYRRPGVLSVSCRDRGFRRLLLVVPGSECSLTLSAPATPPHKHSQAPSVRPIRPSRTDQTGPKSDPTSRSDPTGGAGVENPRFWPTP